MLKLRSMRNEEVVLELGPSDCYTLAWACEQAEDRAAGAWADLHGPPPAVVRPETYAALAAFFEAAAAAAVPGFYGADDWDPARALGRRRERSEQAAAPAD